MEKQKNRWLILIAAILINVSLGTGYVWSIFQKALLEFNKDAGWVQTQTALAFSISFAMVPVAMTVFGPIVDRQGPKKIVFLSGILFGSGMILTGLFAHSIPVLYLTYGVILGLGIGAGYGAATSTTVKWFPDKKGLAGGLTAAGFGSGAVFLGPIITNLIGSVGVYNTFVYLGIVLLVVIVGASFFMEKPPTPAQAPGVVASSNDKNVGQMIKDVNFWLLFIVYAMAATAGMMIISQQVQVTGFYKILDPATSIVIIIGITNTLGRIFWGTVSDKLGRYLTVIAMFVVSGGGLILLNFNQTLGSFAGVLGLVAVALSFGGFLGAFPGITAENWGVKNASANYGVMFFAYGIAAIVGPILATSLFSPEKGYSMAFIVSTGMALLGILITLFYMSRKKK